MAKKRALVVSVVGLFGALVAPAAAQAATFPLTISTSATVGVSMSVLGTTTLFTPNAPGANLSVSDLEGTLSSSSGNVQVGSQATTTSVAIDADIGSSSGTELDFGTPAQGVPVTVDTASISVSGFLEFAGPVTLALDTSISSSTNTGFVAIDGAHALSLDGVTTFNGAVGASNPLASITATSSVGADGGSITTTGAQSYSNVGCQRAGACDFTSTGAAAASNITFGGILQATAGADVAVDTAGTTTFDGDVGGGSGFDPGSLTVDGPATIDTGLIETTDLQTWKGAVTLGADTTITSTATTNVGGVTFDGTVDGAHSLTVNGFVDEFGSAVGGTTRPTSLATAGTVQLSGTSIVTTGGQTYNGAVFANANTTFTSTSAGDVTFDSTLEANGTDTLAVDTAGTTSFDGNVGDSGPFSTITTDGPGKTVIDAALIIANHAVEFGDPVTLKADTSIDSLAGGNVTFDSSVDGGFKLGVIGQSIIAFDGAVGHSTPLSSLQITGAVSFGGSSVTTTGNQTYGSDVIMVADNVDLKSSSGQITAAGLVALGSNTLAITGTGTLSGPVGETGGLAKHGAGTLTLSGANVYTGGTTVDGGTVKFSSLANLGTGNVTLSGGGLQWATGKTVDVSPRLNAIGSGGATFDTNGNDVTFASPLTGSGTITKAGAGTLTLSAVNTASGAVDVKGGTLDVTGTVPGAVTVESSATLNCENGTLNGGVTNNGGAATGAPGSPTGVTGAPGDGQATVSFTGAANCFPISYAVSASPGGAHATGSGAPILVTGLTDATPYTFTVTATNPIGSSPASTASSAVTPESGPPTVQIGSPASGATYTFGKRITTSFACAEAAGGPGIASCKDSNGASGTGGQLNTSAAGKFTYTVTATSKDGQTATASVSYTVRPNNNFKVTHLHTSRSGTFKFDVTVPGPGTIDVLETDWKTNFARVAVLLPAPRRSVFARKHAVAHRAGTYRLTVKPNARGRFLLEHHTFKVVFRLWVTYTPTGGVARSLKAYSVHL